jgi:hypothetical protein
MPACSVARPDRTAGYDLAMATQLVNGADRPHEHVDLIALQRDLLHLIGQGGKQIRIVLGRTSLQQRNRRPPLRSRSAEPGAGRIAP